MTGERLTARIDESSRTTGNGIIYVVGASVVLRGDESRAAHELRRLRLPGQEFLHWQTESAERRRMLLEVVADLGFTAFVVTSHPVAPRRQERACSPRSQTAGACAVGGRGHRSSLDRVPWPVAGPPRRSDVHRRETAGNRGAFVPVRARWEARQPTDVGRRHHHERGGVRPDDSRPALLGDPARGSPRNFEGGPLTRMWPGSQRPLGIPGHYFQQLNSR